MDPDRQWALGRLHLGVLQPVPQLQPDASIQVLLHGDVRHASDLRTDSADGTPSGRAAELVRAVYRRDGVMVASRLEGAYCAAILDPAARTLTLMTDPLGSYPLYWAKSDDGFVFGSELRGVLRSGVVPRELDPAAVADYLAFGFPFGVKTLARGVQLVPPGVALTYCWHTRTVTITPYVRMTDAFTPWPGTREEFFEELSGRFKQSVDRAFTGDHQFGLSLSGGMDSRAILSAINGRSSTLMSYTLGVKGCADQVIANRLASLGGTSHLFFELDSRYLSDFLPNLARLVSLTDGMYLSHGLTEILALNFLAQTNVDVLLRGHGGELAKASLAWPFHTDARVHAMRDRQEFISYVLGRVNYISQAIDYPALFTRDWASQIAETPRASMEYALDGVALAPADLCSYLYLMEHHRRFTVASLELFRQQVEVRLPFVDHQFLSLLFRAPSEWRDGCGIHRTITARHHAALLRVRNSNTGAPADAGPLMEAALDKVNTVLKRLNVPGYRHYHNFDAWMKAQLLESVQSVLLDRQALQRGIFKEQALRSLIEETRNGASNHAYLLQVLLIIELWQRENL